MQARDVVEALFGILTLIWMCEVLKELKNHRVEKILKEINKTGDWL
jgi:hypothetical protein